MFGVFGMVLLTEPIKLFQLDGLPMALTPLPNIAIALTNRVCVN